jgi:hypothetical protein
MPSCIWETELNLTILFQLQTFHTDFKTVTIINGRQLRISFGLLQRYILLYIFRREKKSPKKPWGRITANQPRFENILHMRRLVVCYRRFITTFNSKALQEDGTDILPATHYKSTLRKILEDRRQQQQEIVISADRGQYWKWELATVSHVGYLHCSAVPLSQVKKLQGFRTVEILRVCCCVQEYLFVNITQNQVLVSRSVMICKQVFGVT